MMRILKSIAACSSALFFTLVVFGNIFDYTINFTAVIHVLSMGTTFKSPEVMGRALTLPLYHHLAYWIIIFTERMECSTYGRNFRQHDDVGNIIFKY